MHDLSLLEDLLVIFAAGILVVLAVARLGLPSIAGLIVAGMLVGPHALSLVSERSNVEVLAEVGVVLLLFGVGLELPLDRLRRLLRPILVGGSLQVGFTLAGAFICARALGLEHRSATLLALVVVPSSTAIVLRSLTARGELDAPHGRQMLGILLFQDLCVVPMMLVLPALTSDGNAEGHSVLASLCRSAALLAAIVVLAKLVVPRALHMVALSRQRDVFVLAVLAVGLGTAWAASLSGVSLALGAFLAGVVMAGGKYSHQAMGDLIPFREVFASLFFVSTGMLLDPSLIAQAPQTVLGWFLVLLFGKALVVLLVGGVMGLSLRISMLSALGLSQVGEFGLVLLGAIDEKGALDAELHGYLLTASILSMVVTPLLLMLSPQVSSFVEGLPWLTRLFRQSAGAPLTQAARPLRDHVIIAGYGVAGRTLAHRLRSEEVDVWVVDLNARLVKEAADDGFSAIYGDIGTPAVLEHLAAPHAMELVLLISDASALARAVSVARREAPSVVITVRALYQGDIEKLAALGADHVVAAEVETGRTITEQVLLRASLPPPSLD